MPSSKMQPLHRSQQAVIDKYLRYYAEPEAAIAQKLFSEQALFHHCLCVPFYDEAPELLKPILQLAKNNTLLVIAVVNQPDTLTAPSDCNEAFIAAIKEQFSPLSNEKNLSLYQLTPISQLLVIDRYSETNALPYKQGVGLARKIAADIATALINVRTIASRWIHCTDADAKLPEKYYSATATYNPDSNAALLYPFKHRNTGNSNLESTIQRATELYELRLLQYRDGLRKAKSPYAFYTLGSTLCISSYYYAVVRGFPKRNAAEDFYLLNKLQKAGGVIELSQPTITLQSRLSTRAPFGTGAAVIEITEGVDMENQPIFYHPALFSLLEKLLEWFELIAQQESRDGLTLWQESLTKLFCNSIKNKNNECKNNFFQLAAKPAINALELLGFSHCLRHCQTHCQADILFKRHLHEWFDAFRTLKWLHHLRNSLEELENINLKELRSITAKMH